MSIRQWLLIITVLTTLGMWIAGATIPQAIITIIVTLIGV